MLKVVQTGIVCGILIFLNACQTVNTRQNPNSKELQPGRYAILHDFAPTGPIPTFFKAVVPKDEPLSKYGNPPSYRVGGKTYVVQRSARGYKARGNASWYASKFHQQRTSSGEPYDMYALTPAQSTTASMLAFKKTLRDKFDTVIALLSPPAAASDEEHRPGPNI
jgi:rare lipoprotein A (peptidoglycan hydrolase)